MRILKQPEYEILFNPVEANRKSIVESARLCYRSAGKGERSDSILIDDLVKADHWTPIEMASVKVRFTLDRGLSHEQVRHRLASYNQESTRYCNYSKDKFGNEITVLKPVEIEEGSLEYYIWKDDCERAEKTYLKLLNLGVKPETARAVLPTCLTTTIDVKANLREWYHIMKLRTDRHAHPDFRIALHGLLIDFARDYPEIFGNLCNDRNPKIIEDFVKKGQN